MKQTEINTLKNLLLKMVNEIDAMGEETAVDTFSEFYDLDEIKNAVYNVMDYIIDDMPVEEE